ncbi:MAG TPA: hypothetical protein VIF12_04515 [Micavibrio sp.]|jgi:hypothetical protein
MSYLDTFTQDQRNLLVALPYRVGLWVSSSDTTGGDDADKAEMIALSSIVTSYAEDYLKSEFVQALMEEMISRSAEWSQWGRNLDEVAGECIRAVSMISERLDRKDAMSFKYNLMEIATSVAMAYRELDHNQSFLFKLRVYSRVMIDRKRAKQGGRITGTLTEMMNISAAEQAALDSLSRALGLDKIEYIS